MTTFKQTLLAVFLALFGVTSASAQTKSNFADTIKKMADGKRLVFLAQKATFRSGTGVDMGLGKAVTASGNHSVVLADGFKLEIKADSVISFLPYFVGNDRSADKYDNYATVTVDITGTRYATAAYKYKVKQKKKGDVEIEINPEGNTIIEQFLLEISPSGVAQLTLNMQERAAIVYDGVVQL